MDRTKIGRGLIIAGIAGAAFYFFVSILSRGRLEAAPAWILSIEIFVLMGLLGLWLARSAAKDEAPRRRPLHDLAGRILALPVFAWVFLGFLLIFFLFFLSPVFLNVNRQMAYYSGYIPNLNPIGNDLRVMVELIEGWIQRGESPYTIQFYPPLTYLLFSPLLLIRDPASLYRIFTLFTFVSYSLLTLLLPLKILDREHRSLVILLFVTGLFSYGFQFELERGQYNVFAFLLCLVSIYIFHRHPEYRLLAYVLFSISIQLKLYPAIFVFLFVDDWRDWKPTLLRFAGLGLFNFLLLFALGPAIFWDFLRSVSAQVVSPSWIGVWNHSISSFISVFKQDGFGLIGRETLRMFRQNADWFQAGLLLTFVALFLCNLLFFHLRRKAGLDPYLLLACTIGALVLPISYDYTLSLLTVPVLLLLSAIPETNRPVQQSVSDVLVFALSAAYFALLIPYNYRPYPLSNGFPLLLLILILETLLNALHYRGAAPGANAWDHA